MYSPSPTIDPVLAIHHELDQLERTRNSPVPLSAAATSAAGTSAAGSFVDFLTTRAQNANTLLCVGLDPHEADIGSGGALGAKLFCLRLIEQTARYAACFKPNAAFFEAFGPEGVQALNEVIAAVPKDIPVILDAKRGDIGSTSAAYAVASFERSGASSVTINPYLGTDGVAPFLKDPTKGAFMLCHTSNPGSKDFQRCQLQDGRMLYEAVASKAEEWNGNNNLGLVVGATSPDVMAHVRSLVPTMWILAPGVGAQGGDLEATVNAGVSKDGMGLLINVSRGISRAPDPAAAAASFCEQINAARSAAGAVVEEAQELQPYQQKFLELALQMEVLRFGEFTLKSGRQSPYFFNAGLFQTGKALAAVGSSYADAINASGIEFDALFGPAYKGITLVATTAIAMGAKFDRDVPYTYNRKEAKDHGEGGSLVGAQLKGKRVLILDDVITAGTAIREAMEIMKTAEATVVGVVVALDRQEVGGGQTDQTCSAIQSVEKEFGIPVVSIVRLKHIISFLKLQKGKEEMLEKMRAYRDNFGVVY